MPHHARPSKNRHSCISDISCSVPHIHFPSYLPSTLLTSVIPCLLVTDILINTRYTITETHLMIKSRVLVRQKIEIESIREIENTSTILSSPALSFDRIVIRYGIYDETVISPKDKTVFCKLLKDRNHSIVVNI